jgi:cell division protease FtsH
VNVFRKALVLCASVACLCASAAAVAAPVVSAGPNTAERAAAAERVVPTTITKAIGALRDGSASSARIENPGSEPVLILTTRGKKFSTPVPETLLPTVVGAAAKGGVALSIVDAPRIPFGGTEIVEPAPAAGFDLSAWVQTWGPLILFLALIVLMAFAIRQVGGARFKQNTRPTTTNVRFDEVAGIDEIRDEVSEIADFLKAPERFHRLGATLPKGVMLYGAPGTGKTLLAKAIAAEAGVPFFSASGSEFVEVYAGLGSKRVRALFDAARKAAPAVVYIDEIDAIGGKRTGGPGSGEREQTLDQLLAEMDGFETNGDKPVVVLASTNRLDDLDPALVRSGRFDRKIAVGLPGRIAREEILEVHTRNRPLTPGTKIADVAAFTAGMAGADLAALCNEASFEAARAGTDTIDLAHFRKALLRLAAGPEKRNRIMSDDERRLVAYHEIGHAVVGHLSPRCDEVERVTVIPQGQALGVTISLPSEDRFLYTRRDCLDRLAMLLAGRAAEEIIFGEMTSGAADDFARATSLARKMAGELGMGEPSTAQSIAATFGDGKSSGGGDERIERQARVLLEEAYEAARSTIETHIDQVHRGATLLLEKEAIGREEVEAIFGKRPVVGRFTPLA